MPKHQMTDEDRFVSSVYQTLGWAQRNTRALVLGGAALAILVFGVKYYVDYQARVRDTASTEIQAIRYGLDAGNLDQVTERLRTFIAQFGGTRYGKEARVLLANALLLQNRAEEAIQPARQAAEDLGRSPLASRAAFLLAAAYEEVSDTTAAIRVYEDIGTRVDQRIERSRALEGAARLRYARGDRAGAATLYEQLRALTPEDAPAREFYRLRAAEARAEALATGERPAERGADEGGV